MHNFFEYVEPLPPAELISNYWHFLRSIDASERKALGPIELVLRSRAVARGWPVALKNQTLALVSEVEVSPKTELSFVDISEVSKVCFFGAHMVLPFVTAGAVARSPLAVRVSHADLKQRLSEVCAEIRETWPTRIYFDTDPTTHGSDELINLNTVLTSVVVALEELQKDPIVNAELNDCMSFHIVNAMDMKDIALTLKESGEIELAFRFSRALPKNLDEKILTLFSGIL